MSHLTVRSGYENLTDRLNQFPQGAAVEDLLFRILEMLFTEKEAQLISQIPIKPFTAEKAAGIWKKPLGESAAILDELASRGLLLDMETADGMQTYLLPPPMAGFFEFSLMRLNDRIDQKILAELFYQYMNVEEDFIKGLFTQGETQLGRTFVNEKVLTSEQDLHVLDYERASQVVKTAGTIGVGMCYCRHKMAHRGEACDAPMDICMTFNTTAASLTKHGIAREIDAAECMDLLEEAYAWDLVQFGENVQDGVNFICNCCGCCCEALLAQKRFGLLHPVHTTNYIPRIAESACTGCGRCAAACPVDAMSMVSAGEDQKSRKKKAVLQEDQCLGCGVCVRKCTQGALTLEPRKKRVITPVNSVHKTVLMAIERGKLANLIFDNQALKSHRAMAAILGVILKMPPVKQIMASEQMKSRYLAQLLR